jgi:hypothetical protein
MAKGGIKTCKVKLAPVVDLAEPLSEGKLVAFNAGPDGSVYVAIAQGPIDDRRMNKSGSSFVKTVAEHPQTYRVMKCSDGKLALDVVIKDEKFNIHFVQPLGHGELLLACARSHYRSREDIEKNGRIYSLDGRFLREILFGDGLQSVQATSAGMIWTGYSDEGIFGNYGWDDPIGAPGLIGWYSSGEKFYEFEPLAGLDAMADCYALNVASESEVWCYYYTPFPLLRIRRQRIDGVWMCPVKGSDAFAIGQEFALFRGGYNRHDEYHLLQLSSNGKLETIAKIELEDENGEGFDADRVVGRGSSLFLLRRSKLYQVEVSTVACSIGL